MLSAFNVYVVKLNRRTVTLQHHTLIVFLRSHSTVSDFYPLRSLQKLRSSFIPALTAGANSWIHLCCRTVCEPDWDLQTFKMITFFFCLVFSLCLSSSLPPLSLFFFFCLLISVFLFSSSTIITASFTTHSVSFFFFISLAGLRPIVLSEGSNRAGGQQVFCLSHRQSWYVCDKVLNSGHHPLSCHSLWPKNREWGPVDSWLGACCRERCNGWDLDIVASSDVMEAEAGQGSEAYYQMNSITLDSLKITKWFKFKWKSLTLGITFNLMEKDIASQQEGCTWITILLSIYSTI